RATAPPPRQTRELPREGLGRLGAEGDRGRAREPGRVVDARVAVRIDDHDVARPAEPGDDGKVRLIAGGEDDGVLLAAEGGQLALQGRADLQRAAGDARSRVGKLPPACWPKWGAGARSRAVWIASVPWATREPVVPAPQRSTASR